MLKTMQNHISSTSHSNHYEKIHHESSQSPDQNLNEKRDNKFFSERHKINGFLIKIPTKKTFGKHDIFSPE